MGHQSPFDKPDMEPAVAAGPIPSMAWPVVWLVLTAYAVFSLTLDFIADPRDGWLALAISGGCYYLALLFHRKRCEEREEWRQEKFDAWMHKPLPPAPVTDWERFEYDVARMVAKQEDPRRIGGINGKGKRDKGGRVKHPAESYHTKWAKGGIMQDDWR